jgi:phosphoglycolate phosphatase-like HAD superfamily hydrolase
MNKAVIFDWSGTISNNFELFCKVVEKFHDHFNKPKISREEIRNTFTIPYMLFWNKHFPQLLKEDQDVLYRKFIMEVGSPEVFDGVFETLVDLKKKGYLLFVVTADNPPTLFPEMERYGLKDMFTGMVYSIHEKEIGLKHLVEKYSLDKKHSYYVGDTSGDVAAGKDAGLNSIGVTWGFQCKTNLAKSEPDFLIEDLNELRKLL